MYYIMWVRNNLFYILDQNRIFCGMYDNFQKALYACQQMNGNLLSGAISTSPYSLPYNSGSVYTPMPLINPNNLNTYSFLSPNPAPNYNYQQPQFRQPQYQQPQFQQPFVSNFNYQQPQMNQQPQYQQPQMAEQPQYQQPQYNNFNNGYTSFSQPTQDLVTPQPVYQQPIVNEPQPQPQPQPQPIKEVEPIVPKVVEKQKTEELINYDNSTDEWNIDSKKVKNFIDKFSKK
ncbi:hypothetical protein SCORR_v1c03560 [Spiroplasma corruscae]|uniref:Uncharacterized protein n=1 Tax=Spiroplasma corruscae TaxID=216934 RepID=A0A222ENQ4_9MOLU|nr:hypothetical protein [Spiroplasma corruscae]ASP28130.1 hypothetical protein SCORR_v1c03560 [Spiroplasma corruscae]